MFYNNNDRITDNFIDLDDFDKPITLQYDMTNFNKPKKIKKTASQTHQQPQTQPQNNNQTFGKFEEFDDLYGDL